MEPGAQRAEDLGHIPPQVVDWGGVDRQQSAWSRSRCGACRHGQPRARPQRLVTRATYWSMSTLWTAEETRAETTTLPAVAAEPGASAKPRTRPTARRAGTGSLPSLTYCYEPPKYAVAG